MRVENVKITTGIFRRNNNFSSVHSGGFDMSSYDLQLAFWSMAAFSGLILVCLNLWLKDQ